MALLAGVGDDGIAALPKPAVSDQHDATASATALSVFSDCPRKYYLRHYLDFHIEEPDTLGLEADYEEPSAPAGSEIGTQVHHLLGGLAVADAHPEAVRLAEETRQSALGKRIAASSRARREFGFLAELEDVVLRGQIDVWFEENGRLVLADYKTDRFDPDDDPERRQPYELQLRLYALALKKLLGRTPDEACLHFARSGKTVPVPLDETSLEAARASIRDLKVAQEKDEFPLKEGKRCRQCEYYRGLCPAGGRPPGDSTSTSASD
jgi:CRISPR/Cas system-associated exonuclease Cas4 (RecB family)